MASFILSAFADEAGATLSEQINALKENGIGFIEPRNIEGRSIIDHTEKELLEIKSTLHENGIRVSSLGSPIGKYDIELPFSEHLERFRLAIKAAKTLETNKMRIFSFYVKAEDKDRYRDEIIKRLAVMCNEATEHGVTLCHENESAIYGESPEAVADLLSSIKNLESVFDPANYRMEGHDVAKGLEASLKRLAYMHVKDAIFETKTIVPAGEGEGEIIKAIETIDKKTDGDIFLSLEPHLHVFDAYKSIDKHELKGKYSFNSQREAFDFAHKSLTALLIKAGYRKDENNKWKR